VSEPKRIFINTAQDRGRALRWVEEAGWGSVVEFKQKGRTLDQNDAIHGLIRQIMKQRKTLHGRPMNMALWKATFMNALGIEIQLVPTLDGTGVFPIGLSTRDLPKKRASELIEYILWWCATEELTIEHFDGPQEVAA
jgi:hypothetical protein